MSNKTIDNEYTLLKSGTIIMIMYAVFIDKIKILVISKNCLSKRYNTNKFG